MNSWLSISVPHEHHGCPRETEAEKTRKQLQERPPSGEGVNAAALIILQSPSRDTRPMPPTPTGLGKVEQP